MKRDLAEPTKYSVFISYQRPHDTHRQLPTGTNVEMIPLHLDPSAPDIGPCLNVGSIARQTYKPGIITSSGATGKDVEQWIWRLQTASKAADEHIHLLSFDAQKNPLKFVDRTWRVNEDPQIITLAKSIAECVEIAELLADLGTRLGFSTPSINRLVLSPISVQKLASPAIAEAMDLARAYALGF